MSIVRSGATIALFTFISRICGLVRELLIAEIFGVGSVSDAINVAFKLPNLFRRIFAEGALSSVFVPIFNSKFVDSEDKGQEFTGKVFSLLLISLITLTVLIQFLMPYLMFAIAPGFHTKIEKFNLTVLLCRITMPYLIFISVAAFFGGILNSLKRFAAFAFVPVLFNLIIIIAALFKYSDLIKAAIIICYSLILGGLIQTLFMFVCIKKANFNFKAIWINKRDSDINKFLMKMIPASISAGTIQLNLFISQTIASYIQGAVSILAYADRIYQFPLSIIGICFGTILLPELSKNYKSLNFKEAHELQNKAIKIAIAISFPAGVGICILSKPIIHILYERGAFDATNTIKTADTLSAFALGLPAFMFIKILTPIFYANHDQKTPLKITIYSVIANISLNICLMKYFEHVGIALGSSIAGWFNAYLLYKYSKSEKYFDLDKDIFLFYFKVLTGCMIMALILHIFNHFYLDYYYHERLFIKILALNIAIMLGALCYTVGCLGLGMYKEIKKLY